jgi:hypothetical protein
LASIGGSTKTTYSADVRRIKDQVSSSRSAEVGSEGEGRRGEGKEGGARAWKGKVRAGVTLLDI